MKYYSGNSVGGSWWFVGVVKCGNLLPYQVTSYSNPRRHPIPVPMWRATYKGLFLDAPGVKSFLQMMGPKAEQERGEKPWGGGGGVSHSFLTFWAPVRGLGVAWLCHWVSLSARIEAPGEADSCPGWSSNEQGSCNELVVCRPYCTSSRELIQNVSLPTLFSDTP